MVQWKKSGHTCPRCNQETEVLVGTMGAHESVRSAETCWRCGWVARFDQEKEANKTKESLPGKEDGGSKGQHPVNGLRR